jgi:hypothetical protein
MYMFMHITFSISVDIFEYASRSHHSHNCLLLSAGIQGALIGTTLGNLSRFGRTKNHYIGVILSFFTGAISPPTMLF